MRVRLKQQRLAELVAASALTQNHWAIKLGLSRGHWSDLVNGNHPFPSARTRKLILDAFDVPFEALFEVDATGDAWADVDFRRAIADRYIIDAEVGQGGMGAVYLARDARHGRMVAIKVIAPEAVSGIGITQFQREISTVAQLLHPNTLPLYESGEVGGQPYFVMPYVRGGSLRARLSREGRLNARAVAAIVRGVAGSLQQAHTAQVLHCDIKPENILLYGDHAWVTDFGIARRIHSESAEWPRPGGLDISAGTPAYVSPEQAAGDPNLDPRSDVFSLGCVVYEMLTGQSPFTGTNTQQIISSRFVAPPRPLTDLAPDVPAAVQSIVEKAMALHREHRHESAQVFADELTSATDAPRAAVVRATATAWRAVTIAQRKLKMSNVPVGGLLRGLADDLRFALRVCARNRAVTAAVIGTMVIGIAVTTAMFSAVNGVLLRPLPFRDSERVVQLGMVLRNGLETSSMAVPDVDDFRRDTKLFEALSLVMLTGNTLVTGDTPQQLLTIQVDSFYRRVFSVEPERGRFFAPDEFVTGGPNAAMISHNLWMRAFNGDSAIVGKSITLNDNPYTVVGVLPPSPYTYPYPNIEVVRPLIIAPEMARRGRLAYRAAGKLKPGVSVESGRAEIISIGNRITQEFPDAYEGLAFRVKELRSVEVSSARSMLLLLTASVAAVLLIACVNIANVLLAQSHARSREFAVRAALGGNAFRVRRQLLTESLLLTLFGGVVGVALAPLVTRGLLALYPGNLPRAAEVGIDMRVLAVAVVTMIAAGIVAGLPSARRAAALDLTRDLRSGARSGSSKGQRRTGNTLIIAQVALSLALVFSAGLLVRAFRDLAQTDVGFRGDNVLTFQFIPSVARYPDNDMRSVFRDNVLSSLAAIPGVTGVAASQQMPFTGNAHRDVFFRKEIGDQGANNPFTRVEVVTHDFWNLQGIQTLAGRTFDTRDVPNGQRVVVLNQSAAARFFPGVDPVGHLISYNLQDWVIIGVVAGIRMEDPVEPPGPAMYLSAEQMMSWPGYVLVQSSVPASTLADQVRANLRAIDPTVAITDMRMLDGRIADATAPQRFRAAMTTVLSVLALLLSTIGIYGVVAQAVGRQSREIGIRMALGEERSRVRFNVLLKALQPALIGIVAGGVLSLSLGRWLSTFLVNGSSRDPFALGVASALLLAAAVVGAYFPARRASKVDPIVTLRSD